MSIQDGYSRYQCDRCNTEAVLLPNDSKTTDWHKVSRITADGATVVRVLCPTCYVPYKTLAAKQDGDFTAFMSNSKEA